MNKRILLGCEYSGICREAFRKLGYEAYSCDLLPSLDNSPFHFQEDIFELLKRDNNWDLACFFPPCTFLCNSGVRWLERGPKQQIFEIGQLSVLSLKWDKIDKRNKDMEYGANFFKKLLNFNIPRICIENPIPHKYALEIIGRKYDQIINPWQFGHCESKATCLWLKNLPKLVETDNVKEQMKLLPKSQTQRIHYMPKSKDRGLLRSLTYSGIAKAMASQWGPLL